MGFSPWGRKESDTTEQLSTSIEITIRSFPLIHYTDKSSKHALSLHFSPSRYIFIVIFCIHQLPKLIAPVPHSTHSF